MKKILCCGFVLLAVMICFPLASSAYVSEFGVNENQYYPNGTINNDFSYNNLDIQPTDNGCVFQGTITNNSTTLQSATITAHAVDASGSPLWECSFSLPAISAGDSYEFEQNIDDCSNTAPYRINFGVSQ